MSAKKIGENIYLIDVEADGIRNLIASYVLTGESVAIVESGPASSILNLLHGLDELSIKPNEVAYVAVTHVHIDHARARIATAADGMTFTVNDDVKLRVLETPGHAPHHLCYYEPLSGGIFIGDAVGVYLDEIDVIVPSTPPPFRLDITLASLERLADLKPEVLYYTHFGMAYKAVEKNQYLF
jgi:glyoxylase-like metal-dependent hydrolase (beta-lactamase superfamily II)